MVGKEMSTIPFHFPVTLPFQIHCLLHPWPAVPGKWSGTLPLSQDSKCFPPPQSCSRAGSNGVCSCNNAEEPLRKATGSLPSWRGCCFRFSLVEVAGLLILSCKKHCSIYTSLYLLGKSQGMRRVMTSLGFLPPWESGWEIAKPQDTGPHITQTYLFKPYKDSDGKSELNQVNAPGWIFTGVATTRKMQVWADICGLRLCEQKSPKAWRSLGGSKTKWSSMCVLRSHVKF